MSITSDLLTRYYQGTATPLERQTVTRWLAQTSTDEVIPDAWADPDRCPAQPEQDVRAAIWRAIQRTQAIDKQVNGSGRIRVLRSYGRVAASLAAACLTLWIGYGWLSELAQVSVVDTSHQATAQTIRVNHLRLMVQPGSHCTITTFPLASETRVQFQGAVAITPERDDYAPGKLLVECTDSPKKDWLRLLPGQTFLAMTDDVYQLITATTDELHDDIPRPFSARLVDRFRL